MTWSCYLYKKMKYEETCPGSWTFIKCQIRRYFLGSLGAYRCRTDGHTDGRRANFLERYLITTPSGFDNTARNHWQGKQNSKMRVKKKKGRRDIPQRSDPR